MPRGVPAAHLEGALACQLEHVPVEQEEAGQAELVDQLQLFLETGPGFSAKLVALGVAIFERSLADLRELDDRRLGAVGEIRIAVAELLRQIEAEPLGELGRARDRGSVLREALDDLGRGEQDALVVAAPLRLAAVERAAVTDGDEDVLEARAARMVCVDVARDERRRTDRLCELAQRRVAVRVAAFVGPLQLDEEAVASECAGQSRSGVRIADGETVPRAARQADQPFVELLQQRLVERRVGRRLRLPSRLARVRVGGGEETAEVGVTLLRLDEQRHVRTLCERHLGARDRADAEVLGRVSELERAVDAVVVGERERRVTELGRLHCELLRERCAVEERVRRVRVQLDIGNLRGAFAQRPGGRCTLRARAGERKAVLLPYAVRKLGLELYRHTRARWQAFC